MAVDPVQIMSQYQPSQRSTFAAGIESLMGITAQYNRDAMVSHYGRMTPSERRRELDRINQRRNRLLEKKSYTSRQDEILKGKIEDAIREERVHQRSRKKTTTRDSKTSKKDSKNLKLQNRQALADLYGDPTIKLVAEQLVIDGVPPPADPPVTNVADLRQYISNKNIDDEKLKESVINTFVKTKHQTEKTLEAPLLLPIDQDMQIQANRAAGTEPKTNSYYADEYIMMHDLQGIAVGKGNESQYDQGLKKYEKKTFQDHRGDTDDVEIDGSYKGGTTSTLPRRDRTDEEIGQEVRERYKPQTQEAARMEAEKQRQIEALKKRLDDDGDEDSYGMSELDRQEQMMFETGVTNPLIQTYMRPADIGLPEMKADRDIVDMMSGLRKPYRERGFGEMFDPGEKLEERKKKKAADEYYLNLYGTEDEGGIIHPTLQTLGREDDDEDGTQNSRSPGWYYDFVKAKEKEERLEKERRHKEYMEGSVMSDDDDRAILRIQKEIKANREQKKKTRETGEGRTLTRSEIKKADTSGEGSVSAEERAIYFNKEQPAEPVSEVEATEQPTAEVEATAPVSEVEATESEPRVEVGTLLNYKGQKYGYRVTEVDGNGQPTAVKFVQGDGTVKDKTYRSPSSQFTEALDRYKRMKDEGRL